MLLEVINAKIVDRLINDFGFKQNGEHLRQGKCPECGQKTLWTWLNKPGVIQCNHISKCGYEEKTKDIYSDLFENLNKTYTPTKEDPNKTANAFMSLVRGLDHTKFHGWFEQGSYHHPHGHKPTATVRFWLQPNVYWERFVEDVVINAADGSKELRKSSFNGSFKGYWWQPPKFEPKQGSRVFLVEGIIDAMSLIANGYQACALMTCSVWPDKSIEQFLNKGIKWVIALDNDIAGRGATKKHIAKLKELGESVTCIFSSSGEGKQDWNDLHIAGRLTAEDMNEYFYFGRLAMCKNMNEKAFLVWQKHRQLNYFVESFDQSTYSVDFDVKEFNKKKAELTETEQMTEKDAEESAFYAVTKIKKIARFKIQFLYFQRDEIGINDFYYFRVDFENGNPFEKMEVSYKCVTDASRFKAEMARNPGGQFTGVQKDVDCLYALWMANKTKIVKTIDFVGYSLDHHVYVFEKYAVQDGKVFKLNKEDFFDLKKLSIKSVYDGLKMDLTESKPIDFLPAYKKAFGRKGMVALVWWFGTLFAQQIREKHRVYPFLLVYGPASSGKSDMIDFLFKLLGRHSAVFNPNSSTNVGFIRELSQVGNMPIVFNETDNDDDSVKSHKKRFSWAECKDLLEGNIGRVTGIQTNDNRTRKPKMKGGICAVQNPIITGEEAVISRFITILFDKSHHSDDGKRCSEYLKELEIKSVSGFLLNSAINEKAILDKFNERYAVHYQTVKKSGSFTIDRIIVCHAMLMALTECLGLVIPMSADDIRLTHESILELAKQKQLELLADSELVNQFWSNYDYLDSEATSTGRERHDLMNHHKDPDNFIAVNIEHFIKRCKEFGLPVLDATDLRKGLVNSNKRKYVTNEPMWSVIEKRTIRCFVFKKGR